MFRSNKLALSDTDEYRIAIPKMIRAVFCDQPYDSDIRIIGMGPDGVKHLCYPLTPQQLDRMHQCTAIRTQKVDIHCQDDMVSECNGVMTFYVSYQFEGTEPSGNLLIIQVQGWIFVHCSIEDKYKFITGVEGYPHDAPLPDKVSTSPDKLPPSPRRARERVHRSAASEEAKSCCWEGIIDIILEIFFD